MIARDTLRQVVAKQKEETSLPAGTVRRELLDDVLRWLDDERILLITGMRRCGKSTLLKQVMQRTKGWCYVNFEDERFLDFKAQDFEVLNEALIEAYGPVTTYFFDEVQNVEKFEAFVRRLQDEGKKVIITGSNASLLSKELGTRLTGRYRAFEVFPFSFREFLDFRHIPVPTGAMRTEERVALKIAFGEHMAAGGLPEFLKNKDREYLRTVFENILYRDIVTRYAIRKEKTLRELVNLLATNASNPFTYNALKTALGLANAITVKEYISYLGNSYLFFEVRRFSHSLKQQLASPRKIYLADPAFRHVFGPLSPNRGSVLENMVYIELRRRGKEVYYHAGRHECDFLVKSGAQMAEAIQVCYALTDKNRDREFQGLREAMAAYGLKRGLLLTMEQSEDIDREGITILPVFRWLTAPASYR